MTTNGVILEAQRYSQLQDSRAFWQYGGPGQRRYFYDVETSAFFVTAAAIPTVGTIDPLFIPDPAKAGRYTLIGRTRNAPELPTMTVEAHEKRGGLPRYLLDRFCDNNFYVVRGLCVDLSDFYQAEDYVDIFSRFRFEGTIGRGGLYTRTGDDPRTNTITLKGVSNYQKGLISFGEEAATDVVVEVIDGVFGTNVNCSECGLANDGSRVAYVVTRANVGSPIAPGQVLYTTDGGANWTPNSITGIGSVNEVRFIDIAGSSLFVGTNSTTLFYAPLNQTTGAPGTWTSVTLTAALTDTWVQSQSAIYFSAATGVYRTLSIGTAPTLIANGALNLNRITGLGETIVAVGNTGTVYASLNNGSTWAVAVAPSANNLNAVAVVSATEWWVGDAAGGLFQTTDGGNSWTQITNWPGSGTGAIEDILFATREIMYISHTVSSTARLILSLDGGFSFARDDGTSHIRNWPTFARAGRLAAPSSEDIVAANFLLVCGLAAGGTDGLLLLGAPTIV